MCSKIRPNCPKYRRAQPRREPNAPSAPRGLRLFQHLTDPARFLRGAAGWATPARGRLILSTQSGRVGETERRVGHRRHFTVEEMTDLLRAAGWTPPPRLELRLPLPRRLETGRQLVSGRRHGPVQRPPLRPVPERGLRAVARALPLQLRPARRPAFRRRGPGGPLTDPTATRPAGTEREFGEEWVRYPEIVPAHREQFAAWIQPLTPGDFAGKRFLDAGCGTGRNSFWPLDAGADGGVAFDADPRTVAVAKKKPGAVPPAAASRPTRSTTSPSAPNSTSCFAWGCCTIWPNPRRAVENLVAALKPGGRLILWVYGREGNGLYLTFVEPLRRVTSRLPVGVTLAISKILTAVLRASLALPWRDPYLRFLRTLGFRTPKPLCSTSCCPASPVIGGRTRCWPSSRGCRCAWIG
jgi:SAM-dependent methyltransferase